MYAFPRLPAKLARPLAAFGLWFVGACAGPPLPAEIEGEPVCPDFEIGATRTAMKGSLRLPVLLTVLDGKTPIMKVTIIGRRTAKDPGTRTVLPDANDEYTVQWTQCENERAPRPVVTDRTEGHTVEVSNYQCGEAIPYKTEQLVTRRGDVASHKLVFPAPPKPDCWTSEIPPESEADKSPGEAAGADGGEQADAGSVDGAASVAADAGPVDGGVKPDAPAQDAGQADASAKAGGKAKTKKAP